MATEIVSHVMEHAADLALLDPAFRMASGLARDALYGLIGPEWMANLKNLQDRVKAKLAGKPSEPPPLSVSLPLLEQARNESREELLEIWASLLATASDVSKRGLYRNEFIEIAKGLDPLDARVLLLLRDNSDVNPSKMEGYASRMQVSRDEISVTFRNLNKLELAGPYPPQVESSHPALTALGREFMRAIGR